MKKKRCTVIVDALSAEQIAEIQANQKNTNTINNRNGTESAFVHALNGSKLFLRAQGYIDEKVEDKS